LAWEAEFASHPEMGTNDRIGSVRDVFSRPQINMFNGDFVLQSGHSISSC
jgi:hypothetical protein